MIHKLLLSALAVAALGGCVTPYQYRGGNGDYYYGQPAVEYRDYGLPYGPYGSVGYGVPGGWSGNFGYQYGGYGVPYGYYGGYYDPYVYYHPHYYPRRPPVIVVQPQSPPPGSYDPGTTDGNDPRPHGRRDDGDRDPRWPHIARLPGVDGMVGAPSQPQRSRNVAPRPSAPRFMPAQAAASPRRASHDRDRDERPAQVP